MRLFAKHLSVFFGSTVVAAIGLFVVVEFRALAEDSGRLRYLTSEEQKWDVELELSRGRETVTRDIVTALYEDRITCTDAVDSVMALAADSPDWIAQLRSRYCCCGFLPSEASDRDVMTLYLRIHTESLKSVAESAGDGPRVALLSACLAHFGEGGVSLSGPTSQKREPLAARTAEPGLNTSWAP